MWGLVRTLCARPIIEDDSLAYLTKPRLLEDGGQRRFELGATGHGPSGAELAERLVRQIQRWDQDRAAQPTIAAYPASSTAEFGDGVIITKKNIRLIVIP